MGIIAFGEAVKHAVANMSRHYEHVAKLRDIMIKRFSEEAHVLFGSTDSHSPYIVNVSFEGVKGEVLLHSLEMKGIYVATGSACSSKKKAYSHVLKALGYKESRMEGAIRVSLSHMLTEDEVAFATNEMIKTASELRQVMGKKKR
jgi:cysteine desulfurase